MTAHLPGRLLDGPAGPELEPYEPPVYGLYRLYDDPADADRALGQADRETWRVLEVREVGES